MTTLKFADTHNMVTFLSKPTESEGFEQIVDFLNAHPIKYALTINPTIYTSCIEQFWAIVKAKSVNREVQLQALVDGKKIIITESIVRRDLQLEDAEGVDCLPNATIFEQLALMGTMASAIICLATNQKFNFSKYIFESMVKNLDNVSVNFLMYPRSRRSKRKDTEVPQPSGPTTNVADEVVNEEMDDSLVRAATTATSLDAEQDRGYIKKTRSKKTLNEPSSSGTSSGGGPRHQETIGDKIAQTRSENVSKLSNDPLLARGNTLRSGEDRLKLEELMALCITLQSRVLALETIKTTQANEITSLKKRVKKLKRRKKSRTQGLKRLYKVGSSRRVESSEKEGITLVSTYIDADTYMFRVQDLDGDEVVVESEARAGEKRNVEEVVVVIDTASIPVSVAAIIVSAVSEIPIVTTADELTLAQALAKLKTAPKPPQDKGKGIMIEEPVLEKEKPMKKQEQMRIDEELAFKLQSEEEEERLAREKAQQTASTVAQRLQRLKGIRLLMKKSKIVCTILRANKKTVFGIREQKKRNNTNNSQQRNIKLLIGKNMEGWKPKSLKNKSFANIQELFDKAMKRVNTFVDYRTELVEESSKKAEAEIAHESSLKRAGEELEQESSKKQKLEEDKESEELKQCLEIIPDDGDDVTIDATPLSTKSPTIMLKNFDKEDLEVLWSIVKTRFKKTEPVNYIDNFLLLNLKTLFEHRVEDNVWKNQQGLVKVLNWKLYDSCGVHCVTMQNMLFYLLVEKIYPLTNHTLHQMFNDVKL
ncbi:hypothetical protein Tco_0238179 [Tanacetum coccineum]